MGFTPYQDDVSIEGVEDGCVLLGVRGSMPYRSGEYTNERNATVTVAVSPETARELIGDMESALEQIE